MATWNTLPREMRLQIWEQLIPGPGNPKMMSDSSEDPEDPEDQEDSESHLVTAKAGLTNYVLVCKEWQAFFEKENFRRLTLHQDYVDGLGQLSPSRQRLIKHIWLRVELATYDCRSCAFQRGGLSDSEVLTGISKLFTILASQKWAGKSTDGGGLTLELSAHSPSDSKHALRGIHARNLLPMGQQRIQLNDQSHAERLDEWEGQRRTLAFVYAPIKIEHYCRLHEIPMVKVIKTFIIRRHNRRKFSMQSLRHILLRLPGLERVSIESWQWPYTEKGFGMLLIETIPRRIKSLSLFEDYIRDTTAYPDLHQLRWDDSEARRLRGRILAERSRKLEKVSVSFIVEADAFFQRACGNAKWVWKQLGLLTLTSQLLSANESPDAINGMLQAATIAALRMPKLVTMELWNGGERLAAVFRYSVSRSVEGVAAIAWQGTWDLDLYPETIKAWADVAHKHIGQREVSVEKRLMRGDEVESHGDALHLLKIDQHAIHPESLHQIRTEKGFCYFP